MQPRPTRPGLHYWHAHQPKEHTSIATAAAEIPAVSVQPQPLPITRVTTNAERVKAKVRTILQRVFRLEARDLTEDTSFDRLGVDSIVSVEVAEALNRELRIELRSVDLFNYPSVGLLLQRILEAHTPVVQDVETAKAVDAPMSESSSIKAEETKPSASASAKPCVHSGAIAIIGYSLRLPGAENADAFWKNLAAGRDCVGEVPAARWSGSPARSSPRR